MSSTRTARGITIGVLPPPTEFGAPAKFSSWRPEQEEALVLATESPRSMVGLAMPVGSGKSLIPFMTATLNDERVLILTETKGLESQYERDGLAFDIRGAGNYPCPALEPGGKYHYLLDRKSGRATCDNGPCKTGLPCKLRDGGCPYYDAVRTAQSSQVVVTNYSYWLATAPNGQDEEEPLGAFDRIFLDEVHAADKKVSDSLTVELNGEELQDWLPPQISVPPLATSFEEGWRRWTSLCRGWQVAAMDQAMSELRYARDNDSLRRELLEELRFLRKFGRILARLESIPNGKGGGDWIVTHVEVRGKRHVSLQPIWPAPYCEEVLFRGIPHRVGMSGTVRPETFSLIGVPSEELDFFEFDSSFPVERRPIYFIPTVVVKFNMPESDKLTWVRAIDSFAAKRPTNGILHSISYAYARYFASHTKYPERVIENDSRSTARLVELFKKSRGKIFDTPSLVTGYDFADDFCRWQVLGKVPFMNKQESPVLKARIEADSTYEPYTIMQYIAQAYGRAVRSSTDWAEFAILDVLFGPYYERNKRYAPKWFREAVRRVGGIPAPLRVKS